MHTRKMLPVVYADKGYHGQPNRKFLHINDMKDGIMCKDERNAKLTELEIERNKKISKVRYKIEQYFGVTALHQGALKSPVYHACEGEMRPDLPGDGLQYEALVPGGDEESSTCDRDLGTGVSGVWEYRRTREERGCFGRKMSLFT